MAITEVLYMHGSTPTPPHALAHLAPSAFFLLWEGGKRCYKETHVEEKMWSSCLWLIFNNSKIAWWLC